MPTQRRSAPQFPSTKARPPENTEPLSDIPDTASPLPAPSLVLSLQKTHGNSFVQAMLQRFLPMGGRGLIQRAANVGVSFEDQYAHVSADKKILEVLMPSARPTLSLETKQAVEAKQQGYHGILDRGKLRKGYQYRHVIPYQSIFMKLKVGLEGKSLMEALDWLGKNRAPVSTQTGGAYGPLREFSDRSLRLHVTEAATHWLSEWQNNPKNFFVGPASENLSLSDAYDDPGAADGGHWNIATPVGNRWIVENYLDELLTQRGLQARILKPVKGSFILQACQLLGLPHTPPTQANDPAAVNHAEDATISQNLAAARANQYHTQTDFQAIQNAGQAQNNLVFSKRASRPSIQLQTPQTPQKPISPSISFGGLVQRADVGLIFENKLAPVDPHKSIQNIFMPTRRPSLTAHTKRQVAARQSGHAGLVNQDGKLKPGYVYRHIIPFNTFFLKLKTGLEGRSIGEAHEWFFDNLPAHSDKSPYTTAPKTRDDLENMATQWLTDWQNDPLNLFIGTASENASLSDEYDNPLTADKGKSGILPTDQFRSLHEHQAVGQAATGHPINEPLRRQLFNEYIRNLAFYGLPKINEDQIKGSSNAAYEEKEFVLKRLGFSDGLWHNITNWMRNGFEDNKLKVRIEHYAKAWLAQNQASLTEWQFKMNKWIEWGLNERSLGHFWEDYLKQEASRQRVAQILKTQQAATSDAPKKTGGFKRPSARQSQPSQPSKGLPPKSMHSANVPFSFSADAPDFNATPTPYTQTNDSPSPFFGTPTPHPQSFQRPDQSSNSSSKSLPNAHDSTDDVGSSFKRAFDGTHGPSSSQSRNDQSSRRVKPSFTDFSRGEKSETTPLDQFFQILQALDPSEHNAQTQLYLLDAATNPATNFDPIIKPICKELVNLIPDNHERQTYLINLCSTLLKNDRKIPLRSIAYLFELAQLSDTPAGPVYAKAQMLYSDPNFMTVSLDPLLTFTTLFDYLKAQIGSVKEVYNDILKPLCKLLEFLLPNADERRKLLTAAIEILRQNPRFRDIPDGAVNYLYQLAKLG